MELLSSILGGFIGVGIFGLIVVFQQEIRKFLLLLGSTNISSFALLRRFKKYRQAGDMVLTNIDALLLACSNMSSSRTGALMVLRRENSLEFIKTTGDPMNIELNAPILESIFFKNSPLHDGAVVIEDNEIVASRVILPLTTNESIPHRYGLRHRAAVGITERTDAVALIVSEETGKITYVRDGDFVSYKDLDELKRTLATDLSS